MGGVTATNYALYIGQLGYPSVKGAKKGGNQIPNNYEAWENGD